MKGVGRIEGWRVQRRGANDIEWGQTRGKKAIAVSRACLGGGKVGYELMNMSTYKSRIFKGAGSLNRALAAAKRYMRAH